MGNHPLINNFIYLYQKNTEIFEGLAEIFSTQVTIKRDLTSEDYPFVKEQAEKLFKSVNDFFDGDINNFLRTKILENFIFTGPVFFYDTQFFIILKYEKELRDIFSSEPEKFEKLLKLAEAVRKVYEDPVFSDTREKIEKDLEKVILKQEPRETQGRKIFEEGRKPSLSYPKLGVAAGSLMAVGGIALSNTKICSLKLVAGINVGGILCGLLKYGGITLAGISLLLLVLRPRVQEKQ